MKKKVAKIFKKYGDKKIEVIKEYQPVSKSEITSAIIGFKRNIYQTIGNIILKANKEEQNLVAETLKGDFFENYDSEKKLIIKY